MQLHEVLLSMLGLAGTGLLGWIRYELGQLRVELGGLRAQVQKHGEQLARLEVRTDGAR